MVDRLVELALRRVDPELLEEGVHAEGAGLVGDDRDDPLAELAVAAEVAQQPGERRGRRDLLRCPTRRRTPRTTVGDGSVSGCFDRGRARRGSEPSRRLAAVHEVAVLGGVLRRPEVRRLGAVGERLLGDLVLEVEALAQGAQLRCSVSFLIWWVALRPSTSAPSVQPLIVLARMTVGAPACSVAAL